MSIASDRCLWSDGGRAVLPGAAVEPVGGSITGKYQPQGMLMRLFSSMSSDLIVFFRTVRVSHWVSADPITRIIPQPRAGRAYTCPALLWCTDGEDQLCPQAGAYLAGHLAAT